MPAPRVPNVQRAAAKWARRAASASGEYTEGVTTTQSDWAALATAAQPTYVAAVQAAAASGMYGKGVTRAGTAKWRKNSVEKGPTRYAQGVQVAEPDYSAGAGPFLEAIGRVDLPARGVAGSAGNYQRVQKIGEALHALRMRR